MICRNNPKRAARLRVLTWGDIKALIAAAGVADSDPVYALDIGPFAQAVDVVRTAEGVEIEDDCAGALE